MLNLDLEEDGHRTQLHLVLVLRKAIIKLFSLATLVELSINRHFLHWFSDSNRPINDILRVEESNQSFDMHYEDLCSDWTVHSQRTLTKI